MSEPGWVQLMQQSPAVGALGIRAPIDSSQLEMLRVEAELLALDIPAVFFPRRPGELFGDEAIALPIQLMVRESDFERAKQVLDALTGEDEGPAF